jgi:Glycosyl transferase family 90
MIPLTSTDAHILASKQHKQRPLRRAKPRKDRAFMILQWSLFIFIMNTSLFFVVVNQSYRLRNLKLDVVQPVSKNELVSSLVSASAFTNLISNTNEDSSGLSTSAPLHLYDVYANDDEMMRRSERFPSVEQRLKVYLSTWYVPPCPDNDEGKIQYNYVSGDEIAPKGKKNLAATPGLKVLLQPLTRTGDQSDSGRDDDDDGDDKESTTSATAKSRRRLNEREKMNDTDKNTNEPDESILTPQVIAVDTTVRHDRNIFFYDQEVMQNCKDPFCRDVVRFMNPALDHILEQDRYEERYTNLFDEDKFPILLQFGDSEAYRAIVPALGARGKTADKPMVPFLRKFRYSMTQVEIERVTSISSEHGECYAANQDRLVASTKRDPTPHGQAIITIVSNYQRHFEPSNHVMAAETPWHKKLNMAVYRGALTGRNKAEHKSTDMKFCSQVPRCSLVWNHGHSKLVDAKLVPYGRKEYPLSDPLEGVTMFGSSMTMTEMLQYKAIIMLEGNDVSSGLKWALFSNSVVLMQAPTCTSWAMEELLQPWVHYIPVLDDFSDVEQKVQWILDNDEDAQQIARNGHLWIADLVYHPDAVKDNELVIDETFKRYRAHFTYNPLLSAYPDDNTDVEA